MLRRIFTLQRICVVIFFLYLIYVTSFGALIRPFFSPVNEWESTIAGIKHSFRGTGVYINYQDVITNEHVVNKCISVAVRNGQDVYEGTVIAVDKEFDLAVIRTVSIPKNYAYISSQKLLPDSKVFYPDYSSEAGVFTVKEGRIPDDYIATSNKGMVFDGQNVRKGNSGSPLFNKDGILEGVIHSYVYEGHPLFTKQRNGFATTLQIATFLTEIRVPFTYSDNKYISTGNDNPYDPSLPVGILCYSKTPWFL